MSVFKENIEKYNFFKNLFTELFNINKIYMEKPTFNESYKLPIVESEISKNFNFSELIAHSQPIDVLKKDFQKYKDSMNSNIQFGIELNRVLKSYYRGYVNLLIFETKRFHITIHIKLFKNPTHTSNLRVFFNFWYENPEFRFNIDLNYIHKIYDNSILGHKIFKFLESSGYTKIQLIDFAKFITQNHQSISNQNIWVKKLPFVCMTVMIELLNSNPMKLLDDFIKHLKSVDEIITKNREKTYKNSKEFFLNFSNELNNFIVKGKELFGLAIDSLDSISQGGDQKSDQKEIEKEKKKKKVLTPTLIYELFQEAYDKDLKENKIIENRGFRSLSSLYEDFGKNRKFSRGTLYNCFKKSNLELLLEKRERTDIGGGFEYRIKERGIYDKIDERNLEDVFMREKIELEKALFFYNKNDIEKAIKILKNLLKSPSQQLKENQILYLAIKFYLAMCFYKNESFQKSYELCEQILLENDLLIDVKHLKIKSLFKLQKYDTLNSELEAAINEIEKIFYLNDLHYEEHKILIIPNYSFNLSKPFFRKLEFEYRRAKSFFIKLIENNDLNKYVLLINKAEIDNRIYSGVYKKKLDFYNRNTIIFEKLFRFLADFLILNVELQRRACFRLILENKNNEFKKALLDIIKNLTSERYKKVFFDEYFYCYLYYFRNIADIYTNKSEVNLLDEEIKKRFPEFDFDFYRIYVQMFPNDLNEIHDFISIVARFGKHLHEIHDMVRLEFTYELNFKNPEFILELRHIEAKKGKDSIKQLIQEIDSLINSKKVIESDDLEDLHHKWWHYGQSNRYENPTQFLKLIEEAESLAKRYEIDDFIYQFKSIHKNLKKEVAILNELREKLKYMTVNRVFELISLNYFPAKEEIRTLNFTTIPNDIKIEDYYYDFVMPEIRNIHHDFRGKFIKLTVNFANKYLTIKAADYIKKSFWYDLEMPLNTFSLEIISDTELLIRSASVCRLYKDDSLNDDLENLFRFIIELLELNLTELKIASEKFKDKKYYNDFVQFFQKELRNDYFSFDFTHLAESNELKVLIIKN